jgi:hypothetical protein
VIRPRSAFFVLVFLVALGLVWLAWRRHVSLRGPSTSDAPSSATASPSGALSPSAVGAGPTTIYAHNLLLRKGPQFRIYVRWLRGEMERTRTSIDPSFDHPDSFVLAIRQGVIHVNLGDIGNFLNTTSFPLKNVLVRGEGNQLKLTGTVHKLLLSLPVELLGTVSATADGRIRVHVDKINILKVPVKALLGGLHVEIDDIAGASAMPGVDVSGNDLFLNTTQLLPPPHIRGLLTGVSVAAPDLVLIYGNANNDEAQLARWHNFLRFQGGTLDFGRLSMHPVDLTLIDASNDPWFDLDLVNYQAQLVNGYSRMTPQQGLEIFMPDLDELSPKKSGQQSVTMEWLQNRSKGLPADVPFK